MVDWLTIPAVAAGAHAVALAGNVALTLWPGPGVSVLALALVGLGYGVISGVTAAAVAVYWRRAVWPDGQPDLSGVVRGRHRPADHRWLPVRSDSWLWIGDSHRRRRQCSGHSRGARAAPPAHGPRRRSAA